MSYRTAFKITVPFSYYHVLCSFMIQLSRLACLSVTNSSEEVIQTVLGKKLIVKISNI